MCEELSEEQWQMGLENGPKVEPDSEERRQDAQREDIASPDSVSCGPISIQVPGLTQMGLQQVPENPKLKTHENINVYGKSDHHTTTEMFNYFVLKQKIMEGSQMIK